MIVDAYQDEPIDALVWRATGRGVDALGEVLAANPGLATVGAAVPEGKAVTIPDLMLPTGSMVDLVQLWD